MSLLLLLATQSDEWVARHESTRVADRQMKTNYQLVCARRSCVCGAGFLARREGRPSRRRRRQPLQFPMPSPPLFRLQSGVIIRYARARNYSTQQLMDRQHHHHHHASKKQKRQQEGGAGGGAAPTPASPPASAPMAGASVQVVPSGKALSVVS